MLRILRFERIPCRVGDDAGGWCALALGRKVFAIRYRGDRGQENRISDIFVPVVAGAAVRARKKGEHFTRFPPDCGVLD